MDLLLWSLLYWATAVVDVETTQACLNAGTCVEGNPLMVSDSRGGMYLQKGLVFTPLFVWGLKRPGEGPKWAFGVVSTSQGVVGSLNLRF